MTPPLAAAPLVGREREFGVMQQFLEADAPPACLVLSGEAGIGKTTLWELGLELARELGYQVLPARTSEAESALSFAGLADLLDGVADEDLHTLPAPQLRALEVTVRRADPVGGPPDAYAVSAGFLNAIAAAARRAPVLIAVDDLPWLDVPSTGPILFAARRLPRHQVRFLVTKRPGPRSEIERALQPAGVEQVDMTPLSIGAIGRVLSDRLGISLSRRALRRVHEGSHGNPLFALELGRLLGEEGEAELGGELPLPDIAEDLLGARIERAGEPMHRILLALALSGGLTMEELARLVDPLAIEDAVASGLVVAERNRVRAANPMLAAAARRHAGAAERRALHLALASAVSDPLKRARHRAIATPAADEEAASSTAAAADLAARTGRIAEAVNLGEHSLRLTPATDQSVGERILALARFLWTAGEVRRMRGILTARMDELQPGRPRALAHLMLCERDDEGTDDVEVERALAEAGSDPEVVALALARMALDRALWGVEQLDVAEELAAEAVSSARSASPATGERVTAAQAWVRVLRGKPVEDLAAVGVASPTGGSMEAASIDRPLGVRHAFRGELAEANAVFEGVVALADERGELRSLGSAQLQRCEVALRAGHVHEVHQLLEDFEEVLEATHHGLAIQRSYVGRVRALMAAVAGDPAEAARRAMDVLADDGDPGRRGPEWDRLETERALGIAALLRRDLDEAVARLRGVWEHTRREGVDDPGAFPVAGDLIEALVEADRAGEAEPVVDELRRLSAEQGHPWGLATARRGAALVELALADGYVDEAGETLAGVASDYGKLGLDFERARVLLSLGAIQRRFNKRAAARASLEEASTTFARWGSAGWARRADDELSRVSGRRSAPEDKLTPTEERVARFAAEGMSNKTIAQQLFVSINTVEGHLSRAYAKLGVSSRGQLARHLGPRTVD